MTDEPIDEPNDDSKLKKILASAGRITKRYVRGGLIAGAILGPLLGITSLASKWAYRVKRNYGVVVTKYDGEREAMTKKGWYWRTPFLSDYEEEYAMANQMVFLHGKTRPHQVITKNGKLVVAAATTFYSIVDLHQYAIENVKADVQTLDEREDYGRASTFSATPKEMIQRSMDSIIGGHIQNTEQDMLIEHRDKVEKEILEKLVNSNIPKTYGIKINSFNLTDTNYIDQVIEANAARQRIVALAEGKKNAAKEEKKAIEILAEADAAKYKILEKALDPKTPEEKIKAWSLFEKIINYGAAKDSRGTVWMLNDGEPKPVFRPK